MKYSRDLDNLAHRSRDRIKVMGEVFTQDIYVEEMLSRLSKEDEGIFSDENIIFLEPSCGHGNIVIAIYKKRLEAFYEKYLIKKKLDACYYAIANSINNLWAIDIDFENIIYCRNRVLDATFDFLISKLNKRAVDIFINDSQFITHLHCAVEWQIHENETLSALSEEKYAAMNAEKTRLSAIWYKKNSHHPINFKLGWVDYYKQSLEAGIIPKEYEIKFKQINRIPNHTGSGHSFNTLRPYINFINNQQNKYESSNGVS